MYNGTSGKWENGAGGGGWLIVRETVETVDDQEVYALDKTWAEINAAILADTPIVSIAHYIDDYDGMTHQDASSGVAVAFDNGTYFCRVHGADFTCDSENGYPSYVYEDGGGGVS